MATSSFDLLHNLLTRRRGANYHTYALKPLFYFIPTTLALTTSLLILLYISSTSNLFFIYPHHLQPTHPTNDASINHEKPSRDFFISPRVSIDFTKNPQTDFHDSRMYSNDKEPFHESEVFFENYNEMNRSLKIYIYPHRQDDPFANVLLPVDFEPGGNYASESYFKKVLFSSHFVTMDPSAADLFFLPFSIARLRHDPRVGVDGIQDFVRDYIFNISHQYSYWNNSGGADHFYVACHSIGRSAMKKAVEIWPRRGDPPNLANKRCCSKLAFFAGSINSPVRKKLLEAWGNDSEVSVNFGHLSTSYSEALQSSKFCLHVKGYEVNTARIGDALYYGCVPVIIANHYDLPFQDILDWPSFSIVVATLDIPLLKKILQSVSDGEYLVLRNNVLKVRIHFQWYHSAVDYDAFYLVMYELWLRRSASRLSLA